VVQWKLSASTIWNCNKTPEEDLGRGASAQGVHSLPVAVGRAFVLNFFSARRSAETTERRIERSTMRGPLNESQVKLMQNYPLESLPGIRNYVRTHHVQQSLDSSDAILLAYTPQLIDSRLSTTLPSTCAHGALKLVYHTKM
jgi:hypothetical protein